MEGSGVGGKRGEGRWAGGLVDGSALIAALVANLLPLAAGVAGGWSPARVGLYVVLAALFVLLVVTAFRPPAGLRWLCRRPALYLAVMGLLCLALTAVSGEPFVQPIVFTIPFVHALLAYDIPRGGLVGLGYLALMALGLRLGGQDTLGIIYPVGVYGALMVFMAAFVRLAEEQRAARERADRLAAENARLAAEAAHSATLAERNRIARELHDTIAQGLTAATMQIEAAQRAFERDPARAQVRLARAHALARETLSEVRRSVWVLSGPPVEGPALGAALEDQATRFTERTGVPAVYTHHGPPLALDSERATQLLRIVQEALQNVERHAGARAVTIGSECRLDATLALWVRDDGHGFDPANPPPSRDGGGFGLSSLRERARLAGAELCIESAPGSGTTVRVTLAGSAATTGEHR